MRLTRALLFIGADREARLSLAAWRGLPQSTTSDRLLRDLGDTYSRLEIYSLDIDVQRLRLKNNPAGSLPWLDARYALALAYFHSGRLREAAQLIDSTAILHPELGGKRPPRQIHPPASTAGRQAVSRSQLEPAIAAISLHAIGVGRLQDLLGDRCALGIDGIEDGNGTRSKPGRQVGKIVRLQHARQHARELIAAQTSLNNVRPGNERIVQRHLLDQATVIKERGMQHDRSCRSQPDDVKTRSTLAHRLGMQSLQDLEQPGHALAEKGRST